MRLFRSDRPDYADGGQLRDFVYVNDCVEVMLWLLENPQVSGLFNVGSGSARSWLDLARALFAAAQRPEAIEFIDMPATLCRQVPVLHRGEGRAPAVGRLHRPFTTLEAGVADYVRNYLGRRDPYR